MRFAPYELSSAARADALFASVLQRSDEPTARQVEQAIDAAIRAFGCQGCAARVAQEYGEHPETAVTRMRWARAAAASACGAPRHESAQRIQAQRTQAQRTQAQRVPDTWSMRALAVITG